MDSSTLVAASRVWSASVPMFCFASALVPCRYEGSRLNEVRNTAFGPKGTVHAPRSPMIELLLVQILPPFILLDLLPELRVLQQLKMMQGVWVTVHAKVLA